jgi:hypothetical protein
MLCNHKLVKKEKLFKEVDSYIKYLRQDRRKAPYTSRIVTASPLSQVLEVVLFQLLRTRLVRCQADECERTKLSDHIRAAEL